MLSGLLIVSVSPAYAAHGHFSAAPIHCLGARIPFFLVNPANPPIGLTNTEPWLIQDAAGNSIFSPRGTSVTTFIKPGQSQSWEWDQLDSNRKQVPTGDYRIMLLTNEGSYLAPFKISTSDRKCVKEVAKRKSIWEGSLAVLVSGIASKVPGIPSAALFVLEAGLLLDAYRSEVFAQDPFDPKYREIFSPKPATPIYPEPRTPLDKPSFTASQSSIHISELMNALTVTLNRFDSAKQKGDLIAAQTQREAASGYASRLVEETSKLNESLDALQKELRIATGDKFDTATALGFLAQLNVAGLPLQERNFLRRAGVTDKEIAAITAFVRKKLTPDILRQNLRSIPVLFLEVQLANMQMANSIRQLITTIR